MEMNHPIPQPSPFQRCPEHTRLELAWPTPNHTLFKQPTLFFAGTRANPNYGRPGWTRDCGRRVHRGCDIASVDFTPTGQTTTVMFTNCQTGEEYPSIEPTFVPKDPVFCLFEGHVMELISNAEESDFGIHAVIQHRWPGTGDTFFTLYAHLATYSVRKGELVETGRQIGVVGATSRITDARNWMAIAPHLHLEIWNANRDPFDPEHFLRMHLRPELSNFG